jgi:hypothetical protein
VTDDIELPGPAWRLKEILAGKVVIYQYATFRTNEELFIHHHNDGSYGAYTTGSEGKDVTDRLTQRRWGEIYCKAIAGQVLLGRKPEIIEQIF